MEGDEVSIVAFFPLSSNNNNKTKLHCTVPLPPGRGISHYWQTLGNLHAANSVVEEGNLQGTNVPSRGEQCSYHTDMRDKCRPE